MSVSVGGLASGMDTQSIVKQLVGISRRPIDLMEGQKKQKEVKLSAFGQLNTKLSGLLSTVSGMDTTDELIAKKGVFTNSDTSNNNSIITLSTASSATPGSFNIAVTQLALADKYVHEGVDDQNASITSSAGKFTFTYGTTKSNIEVAANSTLKGLRNAINNASVGVTASIVNTGESSKNYKLVLTADSTGADNTITIDTSSLFGTGFTKLQTATDSVINLDGISISRDSNLITDVVEGADITLDSIGSGTVTFSNDVSTLKGKINSFVTSYNDLMSFVNSQLSYNSSTGRSGTLFANTSLVNLQNTLRGIITDSVSSLSGPYTRLSHIGFETDKSNGTLSVNDSKLSDALNADFDNVGKLFTSFGSASDSRVSFIGSTADTKAGTYELRANGGFAGQQFSQVFMRKEGETNYRLADGVAGGNFFTGSSGNDEEGLNLRIEGDKSGDYGTISLSLGVAAKLSREINVLMDKTVNSPIVTEINALEDNIKDIENQLDAYDVRFTLTEDRIRSSFAKLEVRMSQMEGQNNFIVSALAGVSKSFGKK